MFATCFRHTPKCIWLLTTFLVVSELTLSGCSYFHNTNTDYMTVADNPFRDEAESCLESDHADQLAKSGECEKAEKALQKALVADVTNGPAHNDLGYLYFQRGNLYLAAWEFEYAVKLMPGRSEPYYNLGMVYEKANQLDRAIEYYSKAHEIVPKNPQYTGNLARAMIKKDELTMEVIPLLSDLLLYDTRPEWVHWAREQLAVGKFPKATKPSSAEPTTPETAKSSSTESVATPEPTKSPSAALITPEHLGILEAIPLPPSETIIPQIPAEPETGNRIQIKDPLQH